MLVLFLIFSSFIFVWAEDSAETSVVKCGYNPTPIVQGNVVKNENYNEKEGFYIIGGQTARRGSWPWMVFLESNKMFFCGGSLLNSQWILTAGHCVFPYKDKMNFVTVTLGGHVRSEVSFDRLTIQVKRGLLHPQFCPKTLKNDVGLMLLEKPVNFDINVPILPVCLPEPGDELKVGTMTYIMGWGYVTAPNGPTSDILKQVMVPVIEFEKCKDLIKSNRINGTMIPQNNTFCTHYDTGGHNSCMGDSGSPLVVKRDGFWVQYGIVSWGMSFCAETYSPSVFTKVSAFIPWIRRVISN